MKLNRKKVRDIVEYVVKYNLEDLQIDGNCSGVDPETDKQTEDWIKQELDSGNPYAWCHVTVTAHALGYEGRDSLGGCSYESKEAIERDLIPEMQSNAFN